MCSRLPDAVSVPEPTQPTLAPLPLAEAVKRHQLAQKPIDPPKPIAPINFSDIVKDLRVIKASDRIHCVSKDFASKLNGDRIQAAYGFRRYGTFWGIILKFFGHAFKTQHEGKTLYVNKNSFCTCMMRLRAREILQEMQVQENSRKTLRTKLNDDKSKLVNRLEEVTAQLKRASEGLEKACQVIKKGEFIAINAKGVAQVKNSCPPYVLTQCAVEWCTRSLLKAEKTSLQAQVNRVALKISAIPGNMSLQENCERQAIQSACLKQNFSVWKIEKIVSSQYSVASASVKTSLSNLSETFKHVFKQNQNVDLTELYVKVSEENRKRIHDITFTRFDGEGTIHIKM